jgi:Uma2 family endonuclease
MTTLTTQPSSIPLSLDLTPIIDLGDDEFFELCQRNRDLRIERTATGEILIMSLAGSRTSSRNSKIVSQLEAWSEKDGSGDTFDSSGGFQLGSGAIRSPDAAWVECDRLRALATLKKDHFLPLCPTFVIELRSSSDTLSGVEAKMQEYLYEGARLGWLIDPQKRRVHVYRPDADVEIVAEPRVMSGDPELPGFVLKLDRIWDPGW